MDEGEGGLSIALLEEAIASAPGNVVFDAACCCSAVRSEIRNRWIIFYLNEGLS